MSVDLFDNCQIRSGHGWCSEGRCTECLRVYISQTTVMFLNGSKKPAMDRFVKIMLMEPTLTAKQLRRPLYNLYSGLAVCAREDPGQGLGNPDEWEAKAAAWVPKRLKQKNEDGQRKASGARGV